MLASACTNTCSHAHGTAGPPLSVLFGRLRVGGAPDLGIGAELLGVALVHQRPQLERLLPRDRMARQQRLEPEEAAVPAGCGAGRRAGLAEFVLEGQHGELAVRAQLEAQ